MLQSAAQTLAPVVKAVQSGNTAELMSAMSGDDRLKQVMNMVQSSGKSPEAFARQLAAQNGMDINMLLGMARQLTGGK